MAISIKADAKLNHRFTSFYSDAVRSGEMLHQNFRNLQLYTNAQVLRCCKDQAVADLSALICKNDTLDILCQYLESVFYIAKQLMAARSGRLTSNHWGLGIVESHQGQLLGVSGHPQDPQPSPINENIASSLNGSARVLKPTVRTGWLNARTGQSDGNNIAPDGKRGKDGFTEVSWEVALKLIADELQRLKTDHCNESIFAGSYGWSSAGRFHHAQSQLKRFLNTIGGFVASDGNYSYNAALVLMPHIVGHYRQHVAESTRWNVIAEHTKLVVMFGGIAERNTQVCDGGISRHRTPDNMAACAKAGVQFVNFSPLRQDAADSLNARWLPPLPGSDTAIMLGLAHTLITEGLHDTDFLTQYTVGFEIVSAYIKGVKDNQPKSADWASELSGIDADVIRQLARDMAAGRTMICTAAGVQRGDYGEQPLWMTVTLAAMLGQIGLPGGGYTIGYGVNGNIGSVERLFPWAALPQGNNPVSTVIPVAMITELLTGPNEAYQYNGQTHIFPDTRLVWWAGGNPFHHHQDLNRLRAAFQKPETIIVNEINWTSTARHADIILPVASSLERQDFGGGKSDDALVPMPAHATPAGDARTEYAIYTELSKLMNTEQQFTEGRTEEQWLRTLWQRTQENGRQASVELPDWEEFISGDVINVPDPSPNQVFLADYRRDPVEHKLSTPSGRIELFSETIESFNLPDCRGHAHWYPMRDVAEGEQLDYPIYLLSGQPKTRLHSQYDNGDYSMEYKIKGREPVLINPLDAAARGIADADVIEIFNKRGRCLAGAKVTEDIRQGCIFLWTGAWYDPDDNATQNRDRHGNPNVLTHDLRTSSLSQSPAAHSALVQIRKFSGEIPPITVHVAPLAVTDNGGIGG